MTGTNAINRRTLIASTALLPLLALPGCASMPGLSLTEAIRRLLSLASQRALTALMADNGFYDSSVARIDLPPELGGPGASSLLTRALRAGPIKDRLLRQVNRAAEEGAERAAPIVADAITNLSIEDAAAIISGGSNAATALLESTMGRRLVAAMLPDIDNGLRLFDSAAVSEALRLVSGIDLPRLARDVSDRAHDAIYRTIASEEAAIRANPAATNDPLLIGVFGLARR
ncbi:MAG: DUF4197 domain-containing protein [Sphingopyxis sp.]|nr:DUF4197 domain-containing protein [Sphingopyxis sp.]